MKPELVTKIGEKKSRFESSSPVPTPAGRAIAVGRPVKAVMSPFRDAAAYPGGEEEPGAPWGHMNGLWTSCRSLGETEKDDGRFPARRCPRPTTRPGSRVVPGTRGGGWGGLSSGRDPPDALVPPRPSVTPLGAVGCNGESSRIRTYDPRLKRALLCQLSYAPVILRGGL